MRHFVPLDTGTGWGVCYRNWRGEYVPVTECTSLDTAYQLAADMTQQAYAESLKAQMTLMNVTKELGRL